MAKRKRENKICEKCRKQINIKKDHYILIGTYNLKTKPNEEMYFHPDCFKDYFNECVMKKMQNNMAMMQDQAMSLFNSPIIKGLLDQIQGSGIALNMLQTPLQKEHFDQYHREKIEEIKKAIKNGKKKRKQKRKMHKV